MEDLIQQLKDKAGLTEEQAMKAMQTIKEYIQAKVPPMFSGIVDNFLGAAMAGGDKNVGDDFMDHASTVTKETAAKISDAAKDAKEHAEDFAHEAAKKTGEWAGKAEDAATDAISKLKGMMHGKQEPKS